jgi:hypothetical protein
MFSDWKFYSEKGKSLPSSSPVSRIRKVYKSYKIQSMSHKSKMYGINYRKEKESRVEVTG